MAGWSPGSSPKTQTGGMLMTYSDALTREFVNKMSTLFCLRLLWPGEFPQPSQESLTDVSHRFVAEFHESRLQM